VVFSLEEKNKRYFGKLVFTSGILVNLVLTSGIVYVLSNYTYVNSGVIEATKQNGQREPDARTTWSCRAHATNRSIIKVA
jgi:hypothetical protein